MATIIKITGANAADENKRHEAFSELNNLDTVVLTRLAELSKSKKAIGYFKTALMFNVVKKYLGI
ncbi:hypothetical protein [Algibacter sp. PT7-4]|uniref:hypothetical protein n=1 Tax=Algibacter ulvanivorans TaxID=3400999 RepID=UPI003AB04EE9